MRGLEIFCSKKTYFYKLLRACKIEETESYKVKRENNEKRFSKNIQNSTLN